MFPDDNFFYHNGCSRNGVHAVWNIQNVWHKHDNLVYVESTVGQNADIWTQRCNSCWRKTTGSATNYYAYRIWWEAHLHQRKHFETGQLFHRLTVAWQNWGWTSSLNPFEWDATLPQRQQIFAWCYGDWWQCSYIECSVITSCFYSQPRITIMII